MIMIINYFQTFLFLGCVKRRSKQASKQVVLFLEHLPPPPPFFSEVDKERGVADDKEPPTSNQDTTTTTLEYVLNYYVGRYIGIERSKSKSEASCLLLDFYLWNSTHTHTHTLHTLPTLPTLPRATVSSSSCSCSLLEMPAMLCCAPSHLLPSTSYRHSQLAMHVHHTYIILCHGAPLVIPQIPPCLCSRVWYQRSH